MTHNIKTGDLFKSSTSGDKYEVIKTTDKTVTLRSLVNPYFRDFTKKVKFGFMGVEWIDIDKYESLYRIQGD